MTAPATGWRGSGGWLTQQAEAFQAAARAAPLGVSLGILGRAAVAQTNGEARCAFYIIEGGAAQPDPASGASETLVRLVAGPDIAPDSLASGIAVHFGKPVITPDVTRDPRWKDWLWLAKEHGYRSCWAFPIQTSPGQIVGTCAMYFKEPREPTAGDRQLTAALTDSAALIFARHEEANQQRESEQAVKRLLALEERCQHAGNHFQDCLNAILEEALFISGAPRGTIHLVESGTGLRIAAQRGLDAAFLEFYATVAYTEGSACGTALHKGEQVVVEDITNSAIFVGTAALDVLLAAQVRAVICTPFMNSDRVVMGVISTHLSRPHKPGQRQLRLLHLLARQAARCCSASWGRL